MTLREAVPTLLATLLIMIAPTKCQSAAPTFLLQWGGAGSGPGQFNSPWGITLDVEGNVYVADASNNRIQKFTGNGVYIASFGSAGSGQGKFASPIDVAVDSQGTIYVSDVGNGLIQVFDNAFHFVRQWHMPDSWLPGTLAIAAGDSVIYVEVAYLIYVFRTDGTLLGSWQYVDPHNEPFGPLGFGVGTDGTIYIGTYSASTVSKFSPTGQDLGAFGSYGTADGQFLLWCAVALDASSDVFVSGKDPVKVQEFSSSGTFLAAFGSAGSGPGQFGSIPPDLVVDQKGNVFVVDVSNNRIEKFGNATTPTRRQSLGHLKILFR